MENPLELPAPSKSEPIERIQQFAYDLAYGAVITGDWDAIISVANDGTWNSNPQRVRSSNTFANYLNDYVRHKWGIRPPTPHLLVSFEYFVAVSQNTYKLTLKAFSLLEKPQPPPSVFISYKQDQSSALALLIEARLKARDNNISIFIDKNIQASEDLNARIYEAFDKCQHFIVILSPATLMNSHAVRDEIAIALRRKCQIVPICHSGYTVDGDYRNLLGDTKAIVIKPPESAEEFEIAMTRLLISLGYSTV